MIRKLAVAGLALVPVVAWMGTSIGQAAAPPPINVANDHVTCAAVYGKATANPPLSNTVPAGTSVSITVNAKLDGCSDPDNSSVALTTSKLSGTLTTVADGTGCIGLLGPHNYSGTLTASFKSAPGAAKVSPSSATITPRQINGNTFTVPFAVPNQPSYGLFQFGADAGHGPTTPAPGVSGAFTGGDGGTKSTLDVTTAQDILTFAGVCAGKGIKTITFGNGTLTLG